MNRPGNVFLVLLLLTACRADRSPSQQKLQQARSDVRRPTNVVRGVAALSELCCGPGLPSAETSAACSELVEVVRTTTNPAAVNIALGCSAVIPAEAVLDALQRPVGTFYDGWTRFYLVTQLAEYEPSEPVVRGMVGALNYPPGVNGGVVPIANAEHAIITARQYLSILGEADLGPLVSALRDSSPFVRMNALWAIFSAASDAPLEMADAEVALNQIKASDPDQKARDLAGSALYSIERNRGKDIARLISHIEELHGSNASTIRLLTRRRRFCGATEVTSALERIGATSTDPSVRELARAAIAERARRCTAL